MIGAGEDAPPPSFSKGARDENSVLFSVKDLASAAALRKTAPAPVVARAEEAFGDDPTGMVDLRAIANNTQSSLAIKPLDIAALRPSVVPMPITPTHDETANKGGPKSPLFYVAIAGAALVFIGFGAGLTAWAMSGDADVSTAIAAPAAAEPDIIEREIVQRTKVAEAPEAAASSSSGATHHARGHHGSAGKTSSSKTSSASKTTPKKGSDPCNCRGVLACAMRCTK